MERKIYLNRYRLSVDRLGLPFIIRRSADEAMFQADDIQSGRQVAVQIMPAAAFGAAERDQLAAEAGAAQQIDHGNIPRLNDFGFEGDQLVYVTEYLEGISAEEWIRAKGPMPVSAVLRIATQMVSALVAAGLHGIVHYAIHPGNIMLAPGETAAGEWPLIKLINLLGVVPSVSLLGVSSAPLNPSDFASPEQLDDRPVNFRSEIYSLGCTIWFLLKGVPLIGGAAALPEANGLSEPIRQLLAGMLAKNPADRPADPLVILQQIQNCLGQIERQDVAAKLGVLPVTAPPSVKLKTLPRPHSAWRPVALAAIFLAIATLAAVILKQRAPHLFAGDVTAAAVPAIPAPPSTSVTQHVEASPTEGAAKPPALALNVVTRADESDRPAPAPAAVEDASVSSEREETKQSDLPEVNAERSEPIVASNSSAPEPRMAAIETAPAQQTEADPPTPAEGPSENEQRSAEMSVPTAEVGVEEKAPEDVPVILPDVATEKPSKPATAAKPTKKKKPAAAISRSKRDVIPDPPPYRDPVTVGHIFPPQSR